MPKQTRNRDAAEHCAMYQFESHSATCRWCRCRAWIKKKVKGGGKRGISEKDFNIPFVHSMLLS